MQHSILISLPDGRAISWSDRVHSTGEAEGQQERRERAGGRLVLGGVVMSGIVLMQGRLFLGIVAAIWEWLRVEPTMDYESEDSDDGQICFSFLGEGVSCWIVHWWLEVAVGAVM